MVSVKDLCQVRILESSTRPIDLYSVFHTVHVATDIFILDSYVVIVFPTSGQHEAGTWNSNYTPGMDFLDHDFL